MLNFFPAPLLPLGYVCFPSYIPGPLLVLYKHCCKGINGLWSSAWDSFLCGLSEGDHPQSPNILGRGSWPFFGRQVWHTKVHKHIYRHIYAPTYTKTCTHIHMYIKYTFTHTFMQTHTHLKAALNVDMSQCNAHVPFPRAPDEIIMIWSVVCLPVRGDSHRLESVALEIWNSESLTIDRSRNYKVIQSVCFYHLGANWAPPGRVKRGLRTDVWLVTCSPCQWKCPLVLILPNSERSSSMAKALMESYRGTGSWSSLFQLSSLLRLPAKNLPLGRDVTIYSKKMLRERVLSG